MPDFAQESDWSDPASSGVRPRISLDFHPRGAGRLARLS